MTQKEGLQVSRGLLMGLGQDGQELMSHLPLGNHAMAGARTVMKSDAPRQGLTPPEPSQAPGFQLVAYGHLRAYL